VKRTLSDGARLILVALFLAGVIGAVILASVVFVPSLYADRIQSNWLRFGVMTIVFSVFSVKAYWKARKSLGFWIIFFSFLVVQCIGVGHLWATYNGLSTLIVALVGSGEWALMAVVLHWIIGVEPNLHPWRSRSRWIPTL
jgi:hypothetical protein